MGPFHIKAQLLRRAQLEPMSALGVFDARSGESEPPPVETGTGGRPRWRQSDVKRLIAAAEQAGLESYRIEIAPDGSLSIVVGTPDDTAEPLCDASADRASHRQASDRRKGAGGRMRDSQNRAGQPK
jgi:hypothetical protein